jgi:hypothetical protein
LKYFLSKQVFLFTNIDTGSKTLNYRLFKNKFEFENYLNILDDRDIFTFCRFRRNKNETMFGSGCENCPEFGVLGDVIFKLDIL